MFCRTIVVAALFAIGCSRSADAIVVQGGLTLDREPMRDAGVLLWPKTDLSAGTASGRVEDDGSFMLSALPDRCPLKPGDYVLVVRTLNPETRPGPGRKPGRSFAADLGRYSSRTESPLVVSIDHGVNDLGTIELARAGSGAR